MSHTEKNKYESNILSIFINLATFSEFEKLTIKRGECNSLNTLHEDLHLVNKDWIASKCIRLHTFQECDFINDKLSFNLQLSTIIDYYQSFSLHFENCDKSILNKIQFFNKDILIDEVTEQYFDIYNQMYQNIEHNNTLIIPSYHYRHNILSLIYLKEDNVNIIFNRPLKENQKVHLCTKIGVTSGALRTKFSSLIRNGSENFLNLFYDRVIQGEWFNNESLFNTWMHYFPRSIEFKEPLSSLSDIFISVKKLQGYPKNKDVIIQISLRIHNTRLYYDEPAINFKTSFPVLQNLNPAYENDIYQSHYLISFAETTKPLLNKWYFRGGINANKLENIFLDLELDKSIPKETYKIELSLVCPTIINIKYNKNND